MYTLLLKQSPFIIFGALIAGGILAAVNFAYLLPQARDEGEQRYIAKQAVVDKKIELEKGKDLEKISGLSDYEICIEYLGKSLSVECSALRFVNPR